MLETDLQSCLVKLCPGECFSDRKWTTRGNEVTINMMLGILGIILDLIVRWRYKAHHFVKIEWGSIKVVWLCQFQAEDHTVKHGILGKH